MDILYVTLFVCYACYAYNRKSVSFAMPQLLQEGLDSNDAGLILSCQNIAFAMSKFLARVLSDKVNPQLMFASGLLITGVSTTLFSSCSSVYAFYGLWFANGLAQGCGWPSCAKIIRQKASPSQFGTLWSILSSSYNVSGTLSPLLSAYIILNFGWRASVFLAGIVSVILGVGLLLSLLLFPTNVPKISKEDKPSDSKKEKGGKETTFLDLLSDPFLLLVSVSFGVTLCAKSTAVDWGQVYLIGERNFTQYQASAFTSSVESGGFLGRIIAGSFTDWVIRRQLSQAGAVNLLSKPQLRMSVAVIFMLESLVFTHIFVFSISSGSSATWLAPIGALMGVCYYGPMAIYGISSSESAPAHLSGSANAIASLAANVGATISGFPFNFIAKHYKWRSVFILLEVATASIIFMMICCRNLKPKFVDAKKED